MAISNPWSLLGLVLLPAVYLLYVHAQRLPVRVPSVLLWKRAAGSPWKRQSRRQFDFLLLCYLAAVLAGVLAASGPVLRRSVSPEKGPPVRAVASGPDSRPSVPETRSNVVSVYGVTCAPLEKALRSIPGLRLKHVRGVVPVRGPAAIVGIGAQILPVGDVALVNPVGRAGAITITGKRPAVELIVEDPDHPLLEGVDITRLNVSEVLTGNFPAELKVLVSSGGVPVIGVMPGREGTVLYVGFDIVRGTWPTHPSFPIFWHNFFGSADSFRVEKNPNAGEMDVLEKAGKGRGTAGQGIVETDFTPVFLLAMLAAIISALLCLRATGSEKISGMPRGLSVHR